MYGEPVDYDYSPEVKVNSQQIFDRFKTHLHRTKKEAKAKITLIFVILRPANEVAGR